MKGLEKHTNQHIVVSKNFKKYRTYLYGVNEYEFIISRNVCIYYVIKGVVDITTKYDLENQLMLDRKSTIYKGDFFVLNPNLCLEIESHEDNIILVLEIDSKYFQNYYNFDFNINIFSEIKENKKEESKILLGKIYIDNLGDNWEVEDTDKKVNMLLDNIDIAEKNFKKENTSGKSIEQVIYEIAHYIDANILELSYNNYNLEDLAEMFNINYSYLSRKFSEFIGLSYSDYLLYKKLEIAIGLLTDTDDRILDISNKSGFKSVKLLNRGFNKVFNLTPSNFRYITKNMNKLIKNTDLYLDKNLQSFIKEIEETEQTILIDELRKDYSIETTDCINVSYGADIIHLNNLIDIKKSLSIINEVIKNYSGKNIVIDIGIKNSEIYLIDHNKQYIELNNLLLNFLISKLNKYEYNVDLIINYRISKRSNAVEIFAEDLDLVINNISRIIGKSGLNRYLFGLNITNFQELVKDARLDVLNNIYEIFNKTIINTLKNPRTTWILSMENIDSLEDVIKYQEIINCFKSPRIYMIEIFFDEDDIFNIENNEIIKRLNEIEMYLNPNNDKKILFGLTINANSICENSNDYKFFKKKILQLLVKCKVSGKKIIYLNSKFKSSKNGYKVPYLYNELGIKNKEYYIHKLINSLKGNVIYIDSHIAVVSKCNDIMIFIIGDYRDCKRLLEQGISIDNKVEYNIKLNNINGKYKILDYKIEYLSNNTNLYKYLNLMSSEEVKYIEKYNMPELKVNLININNSHSFTINKGIDSIYYIKLKNIG